MFGKLYKKIYLPLMLISIALVVFIDVFAIVVETYSLKDTYRVTAENKLESIMNSCRLYISSAEVTTYNLSLDETVIEELSSPSGTPLINKLDNACNYSLKINAVCAYSVSGNVYTSSTVRDIPDIEELKQDEGIKNFIESEKDAYVSLRTHHIAGIYNNSLYPEQAGVITCCQKVYKDGEVAGWLFTDILPVNLYSYVFSEGQFSDAVAFITTGDGYFEYNNTEKSALLEGKHTAYFKYSATSADGLYAITVFDGKSGYNSELAILIVVLLVCSLVLLAGVHFVSRWVAKSVTNRLDKFLNKMNSTEQP